AQSAFEISRALKGNARLQVRMGIHSGPISGVVDVNERTNVAGAGINMAQRVMDCGDAWHILLSHHVAEDLAEYERWRPFLHDIGAFDVKHGVRVSVSIRRRSVIRNCQANSQQLRNTALICAGRRLQSRCSCWERLSAARFSFCADRCARCQVLSIKASPYCLLKT